MRRNTVFQLAAAAVCLIMACLPGKAQIPTLRGDVEREREIILQGYSAELYETMGRRTTTTDVTPGGSFRFENVSNGEYMLRIRDSRGEVVHEQFLTYSGPDMQVSIRLAAQQAERPASGMISMHQLQHPPAKKASQAFASAARFSASGQYDRATEELEKAIQISPDYAEAHNNLGVQFMRIGRYEEALNEFRRGIELSQADPRNLSNLAAAQMMLRRWDDAMQSVNAALRMDPQCASAHYILGTLLTMDPRRIQEGIAHLERAAPEVPDARVKLAAARARLLH